MDTEQSGRFRVEDRDGEKTVLDTKTGQHIEHQKRWTAEQAAFVAERLNELPDHAGIWTWVTEEVQG